jgi:N-acetylglucosamine kinase-like BadF-type ATPase
LTTGSLTDRYVIGIDGGATKTIAIFGSADGKILGRGRGGPSNDHNVGASGAIESIKCAVSEAKLQAGVGTAEIAVVALAAIDSSGDERVATRFARKTSIARRIFVVHDSIAYLQAAFDGRPGIMVESGAGSVAAGINSSGRYVRVGGWGSLVDDEGSGYDIGKKALNATFRAADGRGPQTKLVSAVKRKYRLKRLEDLIYTIYSTRITVDEIASLTYLVSKAAPRDEVSRRILRDAGTTLGELACVVAKRLDVNRRHISVAAVGGVFNAGKYLTEAFKQRIKQECPLAKVVRPQVEPAVGAFSLAIRKANPGH